MVFTLILRYMRYSSFSSNEVVINVAINVMQCNLTVYLSTHIYKQSSISCDEVLLNSDLFSNVASHFLIARQSLFLSTNIFSYNTVSRVTALLWFVNIFYVDLVISQQPTLSFVLLPTILIVVLAVLLILCLDGFCTDEYFVSGNEIVPPL